MHRGTQNTYGLRAAAYRQVGTCRDHTRAISRPAFDDGPGGLTMARRRPGDADGRGASGTAGLQPFRVLLNMPDTHWRSQTGEGAWGHGATFYLGLFFTLRHYVNDSA